METPTFTLKLLVDNKAKRVLFAETGKEVIDFLFSLLSLPVSSVTKLLTKDRMVGCIGNLYGSVENLNETYVVLKQNRDSLLNPELVANVPLLMPKKPQMDQKYYRCLNACTWKIADRRGVNCPSCGVKMNGMVEIIDSGTNKGVSTFNGGFVKEVATYMVTDDLVVSPMSTISSITLLNKFNIENLSSLEEKIVDFGMKEASLESKMALTNVFLGEKGTTT